MYFQRFGCSGRHHIEEKSGFEKRGEFSEVKDTVPDGFFQISGLILESLGHKVASRIFFVSGLFPGRAYSKFGLVFSVQNYVFYYVFFQNLTFRSRVVPKVSETW